MDNRIYVKLQEDDVIELGRVKYLHDRYLRILHQLKGNDKISDYDKLKLTDKFMESRINYYTTLRQLWFKYELPKPFLVQRDGFDYEKKSLWYILKPQEEANDVRS